MSNTTKLRGYRAFATPESIAKMRGLRAYGKALLAAPTGVGGVGYTQLPDGQYILEDDLRKLKKDWRGGYEILTKQGFDAYRKAAEERETKWLADLEKDYPDLYKIYQDEGYEGLDKAIEKSRALAADAKSVAEAQYATLSEKQKKPVRDYAIRIPYARLTIPAPVPGFDKIIRLGARATEFPKASGFYCYTTTESSVDPTTKETTKRTTTHVYARLKDESLIKIDKTLVVTKRAGAWIPKSPGLMVAKPARSMKAEYQKWLDAGSPGYKLVSWAEFVKYSSRGGGGLTHEQRMGASKLSKEKGITYQQALGLVSGSGYYDPDAIAEVTLTKEMAALPKAIEGAKPIESEGYRYTPAEGGGYLVTPPKGKQFLYKDGTRREAGTPGEKAWITLPSELVAMKPYLKAGGSAIDPGDYDWAKLIIKGSTPVVIAATKAFGFEPAVLKGIRQSIEAHPELGKALSEGGWEGYQTQAEEIKRDWVEALKKDSPDLYTIYVEQGFGGLTQSIEGANKRYEEWQAKVKSGEIILLPDGEYITKADLGKMPEGAQQILKEEGFKGYEALLEPDWVNTETGKVITEAQFQQMCKDYKAEQDQLIKEGKMFTDEWSDLGDHPTTTWKLTPESTKRSVIQLVAFVAPAARAALPEYTLKDISAIEWGLTAVNTVLLATAFAPGAILGSLAGRVAVSGISVAGAGMLGHLTARDWADLTPAQRAIGIGGTILYSLPMLGTIVRGVRISPSPAIPTVKGAAPAWKGLTIAQNPVLGRSGGRWVIGARNITLPEARLILDGYHPAMMLETKVFVNPKALAKAGWSQTQVNYLIDTLKTRNLFAGKKSAFVSSEVLLEPTKYIDADEMAVFLRQIQKYNKHFKQVDMLYGGTTIRVQLAPELRGWRQLHDLDMRTTFDVAGGQRFVNETLSLLKKLPGRRQYRISPKSPVRIEKLVEGKWEHMNDLKSEFIDPSLQISDIAGSKLDATGAYSYGRMVAEPTITVKVPGVGKFDIMVLSEAGVRKGDTILRVRQTLEGTAFRPPQRGIARPGVPKDAADYYAILRTFERSMVLRAGTADEWLESWARAMGYPKAELAKVLPNLKKAALRVAGETPPNIIGYRFTPSSTTSVSPGASPSITLHVPSSLGASVSGSLARKISRPVSLYSLSPKVKAGASAAVYTLLSGLKAGITPSGVLSSVLPKIRPSPSPSPSPSALPSPAPSPSPSLKVSPSPAPSLASTPSPVPSPPSVLPSVPPSVPPSPPPVPSPPPPITTLSEARSAMKGVKGGIAWRQGFMWYVIKEPYATPADLLKFYKVIPPGVQTVKTGLKSALRSIQTLKGIPPEKLTVDMGMQDILIRRPTVAPGKEGAIEFKRDISQETTGDITIGKPKSIRGEKREAWKKLPLATTLEQLITVAILKSEAEVGELDAGMLEALEMEEAIEAKPSARVRFAKARLAEKLEDTKPSELVGIINKMGLTSSETKEVLAMLPDRERQQVKLLLSEPVLYAPTRGVPKAEYLPTHLRRKKPKTKRKVVSEPMLAEVRL